MPVKLNGSTSGSITLDAPAIAGTTTLTFPATTGTINASGTVNEVPAGSAAAPSIYPTGDTNTGIFFPAADTIAFAEGGAESMRIDSNANLLIGKTSVLNTVAGSLIYSGAAALVTDSASPADGPSLQLVNINASVVNGYRFASFRVNAGATEIGTITKASATTVAYNTSSDYRLKENITPMTGALAKVALLKPVTYKWKVDGSDGEGFIAHELAEVVPQCVSGEKDGVETYTDENGNEQTRPKHQGVDTSFLVATLTAAIQELKAINDTQAATITALTARVVALES